MNIADPTQQEEQFRQVVEMAPNAMIMINQEGIIELVNLQAEKIFGYSRVELLGQYIDILLPERFRGQYPRLRGIFFSGPTPRAMESGKEFLGRRKDGSEFQLEIGLNPIATASGVKILSAIVDISERKYTEKKLRDSDEKFRVMVDSVKDYAFILLDTNGCVVSWNSGAERQKGYLEEEIIGKNISVFYRPEEIAAGKPEADIKTALDQGRFQDEGWRVRKDGTQFIADVTINPIRDQKGNLQGLVKVTRDITERLAHEEQFRQVVEMSPYAMVMVDEDGTIEMVNAKAEQIFDFKREELLGQSVDLLLPERLRAQHPHYRQSFQSDPSARVMGSGRDLLARRKDGSELPVELALNPIKTARGLKVISAIVDISERKQSETRQRQLIAELYRTNEVLNNFAYVSSHDLKSPLRGLDQLATWIEEDLGDILSGSTQGHLRLMRSRIKRMETLLDDLLAYSLVGRSKDDIVAIDTNELVKNIFDLNTSKKSLALTISGELPTLRTKKVPLETVFRNLISNAIKHHDKTQGTIDISSRPVSDGVEFFVRDDGPGIPVEHQQRVFTIFQTLKPRDEVEGSGIGLALVKKAVEAEGGVVRLDSDGKNGCTFRFTWPISS